MVSSKRRRNHVDNFKFDEKGKKLSKQVENTVGKGEIARYEQFLLYPQCFQKAFFPGLSRGVIVWEWVINMRVKIFVRHTKTHNDDQGQWEARLDNTINMSNDDCRSKTYNVSFFNLSHQTNWSR